MQPWETTPQWRPVPPSTPGTYPWRRSWQWEDIEREIALDGTVWSHRYEQRVPADKVGGEWFY